MIKIPYLMSSIGKKIINLYDLEKRQLIYEEVYFT